MDAELLRSRFEHVLNGTPGKMVILAHVPFMFAAVNDNDRAALYVRVSLTPTQVVSDGQGFSVRTNRSGSKDYVQITATDRGIPPLFIKLVEYLMERVSLVQDFDDASKVLIRSIDEYRRFVGRRRGRLTEECVRGVFAELSFMLKLIGAGMSAEDAVKAWRGPWAKAGLGVHDFTFPDGRGIEVKSTHQPPGTIRVSSTGQLVPSTQPLDLFVLPVEDAQRDSVTDIPFRQSTQLIANSMLTHSPGAAEAWDAAMEALALDLADEWYDRYRFVSGDWLRFEVKQGFPHIDEAVLPVGIHDVQYSLDLRRLSPFTAPVDSLLVEIGLV